MDQLTSKELVELRKITLGQLKATLARNKKQVPPCKRDMLLGLISHWWHHRANGEVSVHPGKKKIAYWGNCDTSYAKRFCGYLEDNRILICVGNSAGGSGKSKDYLINIRSLCQWMFVTGINPSKLLVERMKDTERACLEHGKRGDSVNRPYFEKGGTKEGTLSPP